MKHQALLSSKDKSKIIKMSLLQLLFGALRVNYFCNFLFAFFLALKSFQAGIYLSSGEVLLL